MNTLESYRPIGVGKRKGKQYVQRRWFISSSTSKDVRAPNYIAADRFISTLVNAYGMNKNTAESYAKEVAGMEKTRFMNMAVLAGVYKFMERFNINDMESLNAAFAYKDRQTGRGPFDREVMYEYIDKIVPEMNPAVVQAKRRKRSEEISILENGIMFIEYRLMFIRYILAIIDFRSDINHTITDEEAQEIVQQWENPPEEEEIDLGQEVLLIEDEDNDYL